jgi:hypothetical protein
MFGHAERLQAPRGEMTPGRCEEYIIWQDERLCVPKTSHGDFRVKEQKIISA